MFTFVLHSKYEVMAKNTDKSDTPKKEQPTPTPRPIPSVKQPIGQIREDTNRRETREGDTRINIDR